MYGLGECAGKGKVWLYYEDWSDHFVFADEIWVDDYGDFDSEGTFACSTTVTQVIGSRLARRLMNKAQQLAVKVRLVVEDGEYEPNVEAEE